MMMCANWYSVRNLESQPEFNGRIGTITGQKDSYGFYPICLDTTTELKGSITCLPHEYSTANNGCVIASIIIFALIAAILAAWNGMEAQFLKGLLL
eukprot:scaffold9934_cov48-Cyclotella_meneghiniana.AAC.6